MIHSWARGTTLLEAALHGRLPMGCDINPLSRILIEPRFTLPSLHEVEARLVEIDIEVCDALEPNPLLAFYHPQTLGKISAGRATGTRRKIALIRSSSSFGSKGLGR